MKKRLISAVVALAIIIPLIAYGGIIFDIGVLVIGMLALKEFLDIKGTRKKIPIFIQLIAYIFMVLIVLMGIKTNNSTVSFDYRLLSSLFMAFLIPTVFYHERVTYSVTDAFYLIGGILFISISVSLFAFVRKMGVETFAYILIIPMITDIFAYIGGNLVGKDKLIESISPNKTIQGMIIGTFMGTFAGSMYYHTVVDPAFDKVKLVLICAFLSLLGQLGDLVFSAIKRYFGKKDFSNLIPGHGGMLDRLDSIIFTLLGFIIFISLF